MQTEHQIVASVYAAKESMEKADALIRQYIPFIRAETGKCISGICTEQDDEFSIAMIAFHEAIKAYERGKGAFFSYASLLIKNRIIDYQRKEQRHRGILSLHEPSGDEDDTVLQDKIADERNLYEESDNLAATRQEIEELGKVMEDFGVSFTDVAENAPKQDRTMEACKRVLQYAAEHPEIPEELLQSKRLPLAALSEATGVERKTLERHRKYIVVMLLIQTNGYEIIRGHIRHIYRQKGGM